MSGLETALIILILIWTLIFAIIAIAVLFIFLSIRKALKKANKLLDQAEAEAEKVNLPSKMVIGAIITFMAKNGVQSLKNIIKDNFFNKNSSKK